MGCWPIQVARCPPPAGVSGGVPDGVARGRWSLAKRLWA